jgi:hypothetical protein
MSQEATVLCVNVRFVLTPCCSVAVSKQDRRNGVKVVRQRCCWRILLVCVERDERFEEDGRKVCLLNDIPPRWGSVYG